MKDIGERLRAEAEITTEEAQAYALYREERNTAHAKWRDSQATSNPEGLVIADIQKRIRDNLSITPEQSDFYEDWRIARNQERRDYYHRKKSGMAVAVDSNKESGYYEGYLLSLLSFMKLERQCFSAGSIYLSVIPFAASLCSNFEASFPSPPVSKKVTFIVYAAELSGSIHKVEVLSLYWPHIP